MTAKKPAAKKPAAKKAPAKKAPAKKASAIEVRLAELEGKVADLDYALRVGVNAGRMIDDAAASRGVAAEPA